MDVPPTYERCEQCGGIFELVEKRGHLELFQCIKCRVTSASLASPPIDELSVHGQSTVEVFVVWNHPPNLRDLARLRRDVASLQDSTLMDMKQRIAGATFSLGLRSEPSAHALAERLRSAGLRVELRRKP